MKKKVDYLTFIVIFMLMSFSAFGKTRYITHLNNFDGFNKSNVTISKDILIDNNKNNNRRFNVVDITNIDVVSKCYLRIANKNNSKNANSEYGLVWNYINDDNYMLLRLNCKNTAPHDILDERIMLVELCEVINGKYMKIASTKITKGVNLYDGYNAIMLEYDKFSLTFKIGNKSLKTINNIQIKCDTLFNIGYMVGSNSCVAIERLVIKSKNDNFASIQTKYTREYINNYLKQQNRDFIEGLWTYLDRNIDEENLKIGGKYTLVILKNENNGYDILYYDGAMVNSSQWQCGMLKGLLYKTSFSDNYDLVWYDSMMNIFSDDTYATFADYMVLTLHFPIEKGQIRFKKIQ